MKVVVHAGMHKTGTTSFQRWLDGRDEIAALTTPRAVNARASRSFDAGWIAETLEGFRREGREMLVVSHEVISLFDSDQLGRLRAALLAGGATRIIHVVAMRHWCGYLHSRWLQNCLRRDAQSFGRFRRRLEAEADRRVEARYDRVLANATEAGFDDIRVVSYDNAVRDAGMIAALAEACDLPAPGAAGPAGAEPRANASMSAEQADLLRLFNGARALAEDLPPDALYESCAPGGASAGRFFDQARTAAGALDRAPDLAAELRALLDERRAARVLKPEAFEDWAAAADDAARPHLVNPSGGALFGEVEAKTFETSDLEIEDLPEKLLNAMAAELRRNPPRPGLARRVLAGALGRLASSV